MPPLDEDVHNLEWNVEDHPLHIEMLKKAAAELIKQNFSEFGDTSEIERIYSEENIPNLNEVFKDIDLDWKEVEFVNYGAMDWKPLICEYNWWLIRVASIRNEDEWEDYYLVYPDWTHSEAFWKIVWIRIEDWKIVVTVEDYEWNMDRFGNPEKNNIKDSQYIIMLENVSDREARKFLQFHITMLKDVAKELLKKVPENDVTRKSEIERIYSDWRKVDYANYGAMDWESLICEYNWWLIRVASIRSEDESEDYLVYPDWTHSEALWNIEWIKIKDWEIVVTILDDQWNSKEMVINKE